MRIIALNEKSGPAGALSSSSSPVRTAWRWWLLALFIASFDVLSKAVTQAMIGGVLASEPCLKKSASTSLPASLSLRIRSRHRIFAVERLASLMLASK